VGGEGNIRFRFTQSPSGIISGVALEKDGHIVASFKLEVGTTMSLIGFCQNMVREIHGSRLGESGIYAVVGGYVMTK